MSAKDDLRNGESGEFSDEETCAEQDVCETEAGMSEYDEKDPAVVEGEPEETVNQESSEVESEAGDEPEVEAWTNEPETEVGDMDQAEEQAELTEAAADDTAELGALGAAGVAAGLIEKKAGKAPKGKGKKNPKTGKQNENVAKVLKAVKSFSLKGFSKGMRGKITLLAIVVSIIPMIILSSLNLASQSKVIKGSIGELNTAVNKGLIERVDANISALIKTMELVASAYR